MVISASDARGRAEAVRSAELEGRDLLELIFSLASFGVGRGGRSSVDVEGRLEWFWSLASFGVELVGSALELGRDHGSVLLGGNAWLNATFSVSETTAARALGVKEKPSIGCGV